MTGLLLNTKDTISTTTTTTRTTTTTATTRETAGAAAGLRATVESNSAGDGAPGKQRGTVPPLHGNASIGGQGSAGTNSVQIEPQSHRELSLLRREGATTIEFQPQSPLELLRPNLVSTDFGAIEDDQNPGGIRDRLIIFDPGIIPQPSREINMAGSLKEGKPAGMLVLYVSTYDISIGGTTPIVGNRSVYFDNAAKKFYHVLWTAAGNDATTGDEIPAGWQIYSLCPITDKENPLYETARTGNDTSLATVLSGMLQLQSEERKERLEKAQKDKDKQEAL